MTRAWAVEPYKARILSAIAHERWDEVDRMRVALKRRLLEMVGRGAEEQEIALAREILFACFDTIRLSKKVRIEKGALSSASRMLADAETAGIAVELAPLPAETARDTGEKILQVLSSGNQRPYSTTELANVTGRKVETVSRSLRSLRSEGKITSRRSGRFVLHRIARTRIADFKNTTQQAISGVGGKIDKSVQPFNDIPTIIPPKTFDLLLDCTELSRNSIKHMRKEMTGFVALDVSPEFSSGAKNWRGDDPLSSSSSNLEPRELMSHRDYSIYKK